MATHANADDIERINRKLGEVLPAVKAAVKAVALDVKGQVAKAPQKVGEGRKMQFKSMRQWLYVMKGLREGKIDSPYRRALTAGSEALSKSWAIGEINEGLGAVVGNDTSYGPFVQDRDSQHPFHAETGWVTVQDVREQMEPVVLKKFQTAVRKALGG